MILSQIKIENVYSIGHLAVFHNITPKITTITIYQEIKVYSENMIIMIT